MRDFLRQPLVSRALWAGLIIIILLGGVHLPVARRLVLASASARLEAEMGIAASAARVSYNLLTLEIDLHEIVLAAGSRPPFARIDRARLNLAWSSLWSGVRIDEIEVIRPRVTLVPGAEGTLPAAGTEEEEEATADAAGPVPRLALGRVRVDALDLSWNDPEDDLAVEINGLDLTLEPTEDGRSTGALRLLGTASVRSRSSTTLVERLEADLAFDGTDLDIERSVLAVGFASVELDGQVRSLLAVPELDLTVRGSVDLEQSTRAAGAEIDAAGIVRIDGRLRGAAASPDVTLTWTGESLRLGTFDDVGLSADLSVSSATVVLDTFEAELAGGRLSGSGRLDRVGPNLGGTLDAEWAGVDVETMLRGADLGTAITPFAGVADGALSLAWAGTDPSTVEGSVEARLRPPASESPSGLAAQLRLELSDAQWTARLEQQLGAVARVEASGGGALSPDGFSATTLDAVLDIDITAIDDAARVLGGRDVALTGGIRGDAGNRWHARRPLVDGNVHRPRHRVRGHRTGDPHRASRRQSCGDPDRRRRRDRRSELGASRRASRSRHGGHQRTGRRTARRPRAGRGGVVPSLAPVRQRHGDRQRDWPMERASAHGRDTGTRGCRGRIQG